MKLVSCKSALNALPHPLPVLVIYSTDYSKAVVLALFLLFVALCSFAFCFTRCVVMLALWSPSLIAAHFAFCFTSCVVMLAFWSPSAAAHFAFCFSSCD